MNQSHLHPDPLPCESPGLRLMRYRGPAAARAIGYELSHLDRIAAVSDGAGRSAWLDQLVGRDRLQVVTAALDGMLVAYAAADADGAVIDVLRLVLAPVVPAHHPQVARVLVEAIVDAMQMPWADVRVAPQSLAVSLLLGQGWRPLGSTDAGRALILSGGAAQ